MCITGNKLNPVTTFSCLLGSNAETGFYMILLLGAPKALCSSHVNTEAQ